MGQKSDHEHGRKERAQNIKERESKENNWTGKEEESSRIKEQRDKSHIAKEK